MGWSNRTTAAKWAGLQSHLVEWIAQVSPNEVVIAVADVLASIGDICPKSPSAD